MIDALRVTWQSLKDFWDEMVLLIVLNVAWSLLSLLAAMPLLLLFGSDLIVGLALSTVLFWLLPYRHVPKEVLRGRPCIEQPHGRKQAAKA